MTTTKPSLTVTTGRALRWNYAGLVTKVGLAFGINTLLSRLLGPKPFGELGVAMIVFGFCTLLSNVGLTSALIQKENLDERDIRFCFTCQMSISIIMAALLFVTAPFWAHFFHELALVKLLRVFSSLFIIQGFGTTASALLSRKQDARTIQSIAITSYVISYVCIGTTMAFKGFGVWSLVAAWLSQAFLNSILLYSRVRHSLRPRFHPDHFAFLTFGTRILGANVCSWGIANLDNTIVGRVVGSYALGLYSRAFTIANTADSLTSGLLQVLLPAFSRVQDEPAKLRRIYASVFGLVLLVVLPIFAAVSATADVVVIGLYGARWSPSIPYVRPIALAMAVNAVMALAGPLLAARGKPQNELRAQLMAVIFAVAAYLTAIHWSVLALSWSVLGVYLVRFFFLTSAVHRDIGSRWRDLFATAWPAFALGGFAVFVAKGIALLASNAPEALRLVYVVSGSAVIVGGCAFLSARILLRPIFSRSPQLLVLLPARLQSLVV